MIEDCGQNPPTTFGGLRCLKRVDVLNNIETDL
jgi:hypothetical protein